ncbi:MAG: glycosyltransferase family 2 protein [Thermoleophilaceae bacterium]|nr:glycosyltransferase family 2 protein [Thermoleophilaceae bacterium]
MLTPTCGRPESLTRMIGSLARQRGEDRFELVVASDAGDHDAADAERLVADAPFPACHTRAKRPGAAAARNAALDRAGAPLVLFLDDDVIADPGLVASHADWHRRHPELELGLLGHVDWARELDVTPFMRWLEYGIQFEFRNLEGEEAGWGRLVTINVSLKRDLVERVGGFDEVRFPFHYEDIELAKRMHHHGFRLFYARNARVEHLHAVTLEDYRQRMREVGAAERRFVTTHPDLKPHLHALFEEVLSAPPARGRLGGLLGKVPLSTPVLGPRIWLSADIYFRQQLAPSFMSGWEAEGASGASAPGGPK